MSLFTLPDLGEGLTEAEIVSWHVSEGDRVVADQPLLAVETDKAVVDVPAPRSGRIARLLAKPGDRVEVGVALVEFDEGPVQDAGSVVGSLDVAATPVASAVRRTAHPAHPVAPGVRAAPAVRALAQKLGVDLATVTPSGQHGLITHTDVERAAAAGGDLDAMANMVELSGVRRTMASRMARAHSEVVPASITDVADVEAWADAHGDVTIRLACAIAAACAAEPSLNASFDGAKLARRLNDRVDLGIATDTPDGLFVPVLRDVGRRSADDLRTGLAEMKRDVHDRTVPPEHLRGQTITLSNFGMIGGRHAQMVVVPPQVAIVGAGRIVAQPVAVGGEVKIHRLLPVSLTFDHRAVAGGEAARFLAVLIRNLEEGAPL